MLQVKTPADALKIIKESFKGSISSTEILPLHACLGRVLAHDIQANENVPNFNRSSVDGYAVNASDTFGCSDSMSAIVKLRGVINMGEAAGFSIAPGECAYVPTGGAVPQGADAVVMLEYTESYGGGEIGILKPAAPGNNMVYIGDDVFPGKTVLKKGRIIRPEDIGALAALGYYQLEVAKKPLVGILSTGDELVEVSEVPGIGQVRDVNSAMLAAAVESFGGEPKCLGIVRDGYVRLRNALNSALEECDMVLISGGSSVGQMDSTCAVIDERGRLLLHGIAMKPGKPTIVGNIDGKPVFGLPGHPLAAHFVAKVFVKPLIEQILGCQSRNTVVNAVLTESVSANHGREQYSGAILFEADGVTCVKPVHSKSGLISTLAGCDGYFVIPRDCEGFAKGDEIEVII